jgi:long-chain acyl-CoA synthetase
MIKKTLTELVLKSLKKFNPEENEFFTKQGNIYKGTSRLEIYSGAFAIMDFLKQSGLKRDDKIAIIGENRIEWVMTDFAAIFGRYISVPVYTSLSSESIKYILNNAEVKICFVSNEMLLNKILSVKNDCPNLKYIVTFNNFKIKSDIQIYPIEKILSVGKKFTSRELLKKTEQICDSINEDDVINIIYTSGTKGIPKGVMLTQKNIYSNIVAYHTILNVDDKDIFLSYLPYSHIYERTAGYYFPLVDGAKIYYAQSIDTIGAQMPEVKPTIVITVPRLLDKMYIRLNKKFSKMPQGSIKKVFYWTLNIAKSERENKKSYKWKLADRIIFSKLRRFTGGNLRYFVSGGGALHKDVGEFFDGIGLITLEGYGMTETSPVICVNRPEKVKYGTVGPPIDGVNIKIADDGEILVRGDIVMKGYYKMPEETKEALIDGWLHTGDIGEIDSDGYLKITDRKKSLFKSSGGKYIAPAVIEELVTKLPYVDEVMVIGNERMYVTALIVPDMPALKELAKQLNLNMETESELFYNEALMKQIKKDLDEVQKNLASYEKIRKFTLLESPFTIEGGELTPSLKVKRKFVEEKYSHLIESMYHKI